MYELINDETIGSISIPQEAGHLNLYDLTYGKVKEYMKEEGVSLSYFTTDTGTSFYINYCKTCNRIYTTTDEKQNGNGCCCVRSF